MAPVLASLIILAGLAFFAWTMSYRIRPLLFSRKDDRFDDPAQRTEKLFVYGHNYDLQTTRLYQVVDLSKVGQKDLGPAKANGP